MTDISSERRKTAYLGDREYAYSTRTLTPGWQNVSWGAILGGVVIALIVMATLDALGTAIGAAVIDPTGPSDLLDPALGAAAIIWVASYVLLGLFAGGWVAGQLSPTGSQLNTILHGLVMWGLTAIVSLLIITWSAGGVLSGIGRVMDQSADLLTTGFVDTVPSVIETTEFEEGTFDAIQAELESLFETDDTTEDPRLNLDDFRLSRDITEYVTADEVDDAQRQDVIAAVEQRTTLSQQEAAETLDNWRDTFQEARVQFDETVSEVTEAVTDTLAAVAGIIFAMLFIGGAAAGLGAYLAASSRDDVLLREETVEVETETGPVS